LNFVYLLIVAESKGIRGKICERRKWRSFLLWSNMALVHVTLVLDVLTQTTHHVMNWRSSFTCSSSFFISTDQFV